MTFIGLGSNEGNREASLRIAVAELRKIGRVSRVSSVYETEPMYVEQQRWFLNCVAALETELEPHALLGALHAIEDTMGRKRLIRYGPRVIDLDILFYDEIVLSEAKLEIPHPRVAERLFVLAPLVEIAPRLVHPVLHKSIVELVAKASKKSKVIRRPGLLVDFVRR